ncbi:MAG: family 16 glycosylhydrolase [Candidatus Binatia bacterium]
MTTQLTGTSILFQDDFAANGPLDSTRWDFNHWSQVNNPSYLGLTQMRQSLPFAENGIARIRLDTWLNGNAFSGSEAITNQAFNLNNGGVAFEGKFRFDSMQGGMITGFFTFQDFAEGVARNPHDEIDFEILTSQLGKISTNVFVAAENSANYPISIPMAGMGDWHTYRMEWLPGMVRWFVDGNLIRTETEHVPVQPQQLHMNLWGVPTDWKQSLGDPQGPTVGASDFVPAKSAAENKTYFFDVTSVKIEQLSTKLGTNGNDTIDGTANADGIEGRGGDDTLNGLAGDDTLFGAGGNDKINGGEGNDTAVFVGERSRYNVSLTEGVLTVVDTSGQDGTDTLTSIEFLNFKDALYEVVNGTVTHTPADYSTIQQHIDQGTTSQYPVQYVQELYSVGNDGVLKPVSAASHNLSAALGGAVATSDELVLYPDAYTTLEDRILTIAPDASVLANDSAGTSRTASLVSGPTHGSLEFAADGSFIYTPNSGFQGIDNFIYRATDALGAFGETAAFINVAPVTTGATTALDLPGLSAFELVGSLYAGLLGRAADLDGFLYWAQAQVAGAGKSPNVAATFHTIANNIAASDEAKATFALLANPKAATDGDINSFLDGVYHNLFGRSIDAGGQAYWSSEIKQAIATGQPLGSVVASIISGTQQSDSHQDITALINKTLVNLEYVEEQYELGTTWGSDDLTEAKALLQAVTADPLSLLIGLKQAEDLVIADAA